MSGRYKISVVLAVLLVVAGIFLYKNLQKKTDIPPSSDETAQQGENLPKLVELGSETCPPCRMMEPILKELKNEYKGRLVVEPVDIDKQYELAMEYYKKHPFDLIPTQILYDSEGNEVWSNTGFIEKDALKKVIEDKVGIR